MPPPLPNPQDPVVPILPSISIVIPYASANYCTEEMHILYCMQVTDTSNELMWQCFQRYSLFRKLHQAVGRFSPNNDMPGLLWMARSNRSKKEIERRRILLEDYMNALCESVFDPRFPVDDPKLFSPRVGLLRFLEHPFTSDWEMSKLAPTLLMPSIRSDSTFQHLFSMPGEGTNTFIVTNWLPPPVLPGGENLGLVLPFAELRRGVNGLWEAHIHAEKRAQRGLLRYRYDELAAVSEALSYSDVLHNSRGMQELIMEFRRTNPLNTYLEMDDDLMNRSEKSSQFSASLMDDDGRQWERSGKERRSVSESSVPSRNHDAPLGESANSEHNVLIPFRHRNKPHGDGSLAKSNRQEHSREASSDLTPGAYLSLVCGPPVAGCRCTTDMLCSSADGSGDVYQLQCGYSIFVYPPPSPK